MLLVPVCTKQAGPMDDWNERVLYRIQLFVCVLDILDSFIPWKNGREQVGTAHVHEQHRTMIRI